MRVPLRAFHPLRQRSDRARNSRGFIGESSTLPRVGFVAADTRGGFASALCWRALRPLRLCAQRGLLFCASMSANRLRATFWERIQATRFLRSGKGKLASILPAAFSSHGGGWRTSDVNPRTSDVNPRTSDVNPRTSDISRQLSAIGCQASGARRRASGAWHRPAAHRTSSTRCSTCVYLTGEVRRKGASHRAGVLFLRAFISISAGWSRICSCSRSAPASTSKETARRESDRSGLRGAGRRPGRLRARRPGWSGPR